MPTALPKGVDLRPSGAFRARFTFKRQPYVAEFDTPRAAAAWIQRTRSELVAGTYVDPDTLLPPSAVPTLGEYAAQWVEARTLKPRTRAEYRRLLPALAPLADDRLDVLTRDRVKAWWTSLEGGPVSRKHKYGLLHAILGTAVDDEVLAVNPARIPGAMRVTRRPLSDLPTAVEIHALAEAMPSDKYRVLLLVSAWCGLRFGESTELRRKDVLLDDDGTPLVIKVRRGVVRVDGEFVVGTPKSSAGVRDVVIPPHVRGDVGAYLARLPQSPEALLFPGTRNGAHIAPSSLYRTFYRARAKVGLPALRWHDLRHFSATTAAQTGATLAELQARLGHSTVMASMRYQHAAKGRDAAIAEAMSNVVALRPATAKRRQG